MICSNCKKPIISNDEKFTDFIPSKHGPCSKTFGHEDCGYIFPLDKELISEPIQFATKKEKKVWVGETLKKWGFGGEFIGRVLLSLERYYKKDGNVKYRGRYVLREKIPFRIIFSEVYLEEKSKLAEAQRCLGNTVEFEKKFFGSERWRAV